MKCAVLAAAGLAGAAVFAISAGRPSEPSARVLRVCADPNNLPFSNRALEGFENRIADLLAREMGASVEYAWRPQRRGFIRHTLKASLCDVVIGIPARFDLAAASKPYYHSGYAFVYPRGSGRKYSSLDNPALRNVRVGVHVVGDDYANTPPVHALARRGITNNLVGYRLTGDYRLESPPAELIRAVGRGEVDVAIAWGPLAGYYAALQPVPLEIELVSPEIDKGIWPLTYGISLGVRHGDDSFLKELDQILDRKRSEIRQILTEFRVPLLDTGAGPDGG